MKIIFNVLRIKSNFDWMFRVLKHDINTFVMLQTIMNHDEILMKITENYVETDEWFSFSSEIFTNCKLQIMKKDLKHK